MKALELLEDLKEYPNRRFLDSSLNEAIKELEDLNNRKCSNCKYATLDSARYLPVHKCFFEINGVDYEFYCNKWEPK